MKAFQVLVVSVLIAVGAGVGMLAATGASMTGAHGSSMTAPLNRRAYADQVLAEAPVPIDSRLARSVPTALARPLETPGMPGLVDLHRVYVTSKSSQALRRYVLANLPAGSKQTMSGSFGGPGGSGSVFVVSLPTIGPDEYLAQLVYGVVPTKRGALVRVDAQSEWIDNPRSSETVPLSASANLTGFATITLINGSSGPVTTRLDATKSARLAAEVDALPGAPEPECMEDALEYEITFTTTHHTDDKVLGEQCEESVEVRLGGHPVRYLHDADCAVISLVASDAAPGATATRRIGRECRTGLSRS